MFDSSIFVKKMWALKKWCVTKVAHCMLSRTIANLLFLSCRFIKMQYPATLYMHPLLKESSTNYGIQVTKSLIQNLRKTSRSGRHIHLHIKLLLDRDLFITWLNLIPIMLPLQYLQYAHRLYFFKYSTELSMNLSCS